MEIVSCAHGAISRISEGHTRADIFDGLGSRRVDEDWYMAGRCIKGNCFPEKRREKSQNSNHQHLHLWIRLLQFL